MTELSEMRLLAESLRAADYDTPYLFDLCSEAATAIEQLEHERNVWRDKSAMYVKLLTGKQLSDPSRASDVYY